MHCERGDRVFYCVDYKIIILMLHVCSTEASEISVGQVLPGIHHFDTSTCFFICFVTASAASCALPWAVAVAQ